MSDPTQEKIQQEEQAEAERLMAVKWERYHQTLAQYEVAQRRYHEAAVECLGQEGDELQPFQ